ncbi:hypothetical protein RHMOL_Rhmol09G0088300 [Rhododendron molle]|uniref:Uncharacterized protein n=1 Tax=Rhododendron molle TaxID=49168 RepID=A0ACC0MBD0_RHOML|nr:hypothetical protein RHMOL_Rhmol09G0088300 [Rhododendron molle]
MVSVGLSKVDQMEKVLSRRRLLESSRAVEETPRPKMLEKSKSTAVEVKDSGVAVSEEGGLGGGRWKWWSVVVAVWGKDKVLERLSFGGTGIRDTVMAQSRILLFWYCTTYLLLEKNKPKYQQLVPARLDQIREQLQLEPLDNGGLVKPFKQIEPPVLEGQGKPGQQLESPSLDQIKPFILEGANLEES